MFKMCRSLLLFLQYCYFTLMDKDTFFEKKQFINCGGKYLDLSIPRVMGILNATPDSFYDGGKYPDALSILKQTDRMIAEGADIIDVGAYSSRPGAVDITSIEEWDRLSMALETIRENYPELIVSVDTFRSEIAIKAIEKFSVQIINDISGGTLDRGMFDAVASLRVPYIIMHMTGNPQNMQQKTNYKDIIEEIIKFLGNQIERLTSKGVNDIIIDPGFGFGKTLEQNYQLLCHLDAFKTLGLPIIAGLSRKSMVYRLLEITPDEALNGTSVLNTLALMKGTNILRVHDVKEAKQVVCLYTKTLEEGKNYLSVQVEIDRRLLSHRKIS
jgi:dihydropteroate synthase